MSSILAAHFQHEAALKRFLRRFLSRAQDVEDIAQETIAAALAAQAEQTIEMPKPYLFRIARNLALNDRSRWDNSMVESVEGSALSDVIEEGAQISPDPGFEAREKLRHLADAIASLSPQCRRVFILRKIEGYSQKEVAQELGISVSTVEKHLATALLKCNEFLAARGHEVAGDAPKGRRGSGKRPLLAKGKASQE